MLSASGPILKAGGGLLSRRGGGTLYERGGCNPQTPPPPPPLDPPLKSLCFAILPEMFNQLSSLHGIVLVVSPLISLMQGQVKSVMERGITAVYAGEALQEGSPNDMEATIFGA